MVTDDSRKRRAWFGASSLLFICALAVMAVLPALWFGPPPGHSLANNLVWLNSFDAAFWRGEIYPRWLTELWFGAGAPDFFYYGPLPFWISSFFGHGLCWSCDTAGVLNGGTVVILGLSGASYFFFARRFLGREKALLVAGFYMVLPYHLIIDWGLRQALGELAAISVMPMVASFLIGVHRRERYAGIGLALSVVALILSHLPSVIICACVFIPVALYYGFAKSKTKFEAISFFANCALYAVIGLGLASVYWLSAFDLLGDVSSQTMWQSSFNWSNWLFFDGLPEPNEAMTTLLKVWLVVVTIYNLATVYVFRKNIEMVVWVVLPLAVGWFFMTPLSAPIWGALPFLQAIQFPWRFMMVAEFALPLALGFHLPDRRTALGAIGFVLLGLAGLNGYFGFQLAGLGGVSRPVVTGMVADHLSVWEYLPKTAFDPVFKLAKGGREALSANWATNPGDVAQVTLEPAAGTAAASRVNSRHWTIDVNSSEPVHVVFRQFYWPYWKAHDGVTGQDIALSAEPKFGLMKFDLPAGQNKVSIELPMIWSEKLGLGVTILSALLLGGLAIRRRTA